ncbi:hypothetical protein GFGA_1c1237 [Gluconobacter frateurii NBRC 103465]|nr:hypothetical protein GFGA_1c1237 [Gluconobacter frateurii NBRC 103465]
MRGYSLHDKLCIKLAAACEAYELMASLLSNEKLIVSSDGKVSRRSSSTAIVALAKQFVFEAARAYRICEHAGNKIGIDKTENRIFRTNLSNLVRSRSVNEHWTDPVGLKDSSTPQEHTFKDVKLPNFYAKEMTIDDTSVVMVSGTIFFGSLKLEKDYVAVKKMNDLYGWKARAMQAILNDIPPP